MIFVCGRTEKKKKIRDKNVIFAFFSITVIRRTGFCIQRRVVPQNVVLCNISGHIPEQALAF
jgi:hypothetical protein